MTDRDENRIAPMASRRAVLLGAGALGAAGVLAACGTDAPLTNGGADSPSTSGGADSPSTSGGTSGGAPPLASSEAGTTDAGAGSPAIRAADIPVGGGKIFQDQEIVVTQPTAGNFKAFSAVCTHMGCLVTTVENGQIGCRCHMTEFSIADGSVTKGPAKKALAAKTVTQAGDSFTVA
jgi:nitrite reductase/ring-hydroxylating ferredoxin subunit